MERRRAPRVKRRMPCVLHYEGKRHTGLVHDVSANGVFVLTSASPRPGDSLELELPLPGVAAPIRLQGRVARRRTVPARLRSLAQGGVGLRITGAPEEYFGFVASLLPDRDRSEEPASTRRKTTSLEKRARKLALRRALGPRPEPAPPAPEKPDPPPSRGRYQVKLKQGPRFLTLTVEADSEAEAREQALREVGAGWRILRCQPVD